MEELSYPKSPSITLEHFSTVKCCPQQEVGTNLIYTAMQNASDGSVVRAKWDSACGEKDYVVN